MFKTDVTDNSLKGYYLYHHYYTTNSINCIEICFLCFRFSARHPTTDHTANSSTMINSPIVGTSDPQSEFVNSIGDPINATSSTVLENNSRSIGASHDVQNDRPLPVYQPNDHETLSSGDRRSLNHFTEYVSSVGLAGILPPNSNNTAQENIMLPLHLPVDLLNRRLGHPPDESTNNLTQFRRNSSYFSGEINDNRNQNNRTATDGTWFGGIHGAGDVRNILPGVSMD